MITKEYIISLSNNSQVKLSSPLEDILRGQEDASLRDPGFPAHYYRFLYALAREVKPSVIVELGTHTGISSACLAEGAPRSRVITVNNKPELWRSCERSNVEYYIQDSLEMVQGISTVDLLFIDTDHDGIHPLQEFELYKDKLSNDSIVLFDDINLFECMRKFWREFNPEGWEKFELPVHGNAGFGVLIKKTFEVEKEAHGHST